jgi:hypothetical protein
MLSLVNGQTAPSQKIISVLRGISLKFCQSDSNTPEHASSNDVFFGVHTDIEIEYCSVGNQAFKVSPDSLHEVLTALDTHIFQRCHQEVFGDIKINEVRNDFNSAINSSKRRICCPTFQSTQVVLKFYFSTPGSALVMFHLIP